MIETINDNTELKTPSHSEVIMTELVLPNDTNPMGNLLGGKMMHWMDIAGALAASRHSNSVVVTVAVDSIDFHHPVRMGEIVTLKARLTWVGNTSMEIKVKVYSEAIESGNIILTNEAFFTFVAIDSNSKPKRVPQLLLKSEEEKADYDAAQIRRDARLKRKRTN